MAGRKIRDVADARASLRAAKAARGLSRGEWARKHGIDGRSLHAWSMKLDGRTGSAGKRVGMPQAERSAVRLVEVVPRETVVPPSTSAGYTITCGAYEVEVRGSLDDSALRQLLRALREC